MRLAKTIDLACLQQQTVIENGTLVIEIEKQFTYFLVNDQMRFTDPGVLNTYLAASRKEAYDPTAWYLRPAVGLVGCTPVAGETFIEPPDYIGKKALQFIQMYARISYRQMHPHLLALLRTLAREDCESYYARTDADFDTHVQEAVLLYARLAHWPVEALQSAQ